MDHSISAIETKQSIGTDKSLQQFHFRLQRLCKHRLEHTGCAFPVAASFRLPEESTIMLSTR